MALRPQPGLPGKDQEMRNMKREAAIRQREDDYDRKKELEKERKQEKLEEMKQAYDKMLEDRATQAATFMKKQAEARAAKKAENERLNKKRERNIAAREKQWREKTNKELQQLREDHNDYLNTMNEKLDGAKQRNHEKAEDERNRKLAMSEVQYELDAKRDEKINKRATDRDVREIQRVDAIKVEADTELHSFIQNPCPVPLKQVIAGRTRPVPRVTELYAALRDQREDLEDLENQDIPMRAELRNQSIFQYVREMEKQSEALNIRPPEPQASDLGRGARGSPTRKSVTSPQRKSNTSRQAASTSLMGRSARGSQSPFGGRRKSGIR